MLRNILMAIFVLVYLSCLTGCSLMQDSARLASQEEMIEQKVLWHEMRMHQQF